MIIHEKHRENRLVNYKTTESIISKIEDRLKYLEKTGDSEDRSIFSTWKWLRLGFLVPENDLYESNSTIHNNYNLLRPNHMLSYDQALFILLGLNALTFDDHQVWYGFTLHKRNLHVDGINYIERVFYDTLQNKELKRSTYVVNGKIYSTDLLELAKDNEFFTPRGLIYIENLFKGKKQNCKDIETGIPVKRLIIYKKTLPEYLEILSTPISLRALSIKSDEYTEGEYAIQIKKNLGVGGATIKKELTALIKTQWWSDLPKTIRDKLQKY
jgi:hypothetical protein